MPLKRVWVGSAGPFLYDDTKMYPDKVMSQVGVRIEDSVVLTSPVREGDPLVVTGLDDITGSDYSAYRAAHFNSFYQGAEAL